MAKTGSLNYSAMDAVKLFGCRRSFASKVIGYVFGVLIKVFC